MRWRFTLHVIGALTFCVGLCMIAPLICALYYGEDVATPIAESMAITIGFGLGLFLLFRNKAGNGIMNHREGMAVTAFGWAAAGFFGALPFYLSGEIPSAVDCIFESFSGFTTTGSSILTDIEGLSKGLLFWRSLTHWLGGMGIIVLSLAILPFLGVGGMQLYKAEVPGPVPDKLKPRIKDTASVLWKVYLIITVVEVIFLLFGGMDLFDSLCHTFGTMATGGFSTKNTSVAHFDSVYIDYVITIFMLIAGINFSLHYQALMGRPLALWKDVECRYFLAIFGIATIVITFCTLGSVYDFIPDSFRYVSFQVASILTTTGYATADYELWPYFTQCLLLMLMFVGGSAGSTGGGMKVMRIVLLAKASYNELLRLIHPRGVYHVKFGKQVVSEEILRSVWGFFVLWLGLFVVGVFAVSATGVDVLTSFAAALACIGNIGPGVGMVGPTENYAFLPDFAKCVLTLLMVLGRLEIYTVVIMFVPEYWRK